MTKAEPNVNPDVKVEDSSQEKGTLTLSPEAKEAIQTNQPSESLFDIENMTVEEKEQKAKEWGHIPKDQFRGDQSRYIETDEFLKVSEKKMPALKHQIKKQDAIIDSLRSMNESLNENIEQQKTQLGRQMQEASDEQDLVKFRNLEKQENALEKKQEDLRANIVNLENNQQADNQSNHQTEVSYEANQWVQKNPWFNQPQTQDDFAKKGYADKRFIELTAQYPNAQPSMIMQQIDSDLNKFIQPSSRYGYNPGGNNAPMGQPGSKDKTQANLTEGGLRMLKNVQAVARSSKEKETLTENYLNSSTNDGLFKWHKSNQ